MNQPLELPIGQMPPYPRVADFLGPKWMAGFIKAFIGSWFVTRNFRALLLGLPTLPNARQFDPKRLILSKFRKQPNATRARGEFQRYYSLPFHLRDIQGLRLATRAGCHRCPTAILARKSQ